MKGTGRKRHLSVCFMENKKQGDVMNGKTEEQTQVHVMEENRRKGIRNAKV
jgi:hypothetical protein